MEQNDKFFTNKWGGVHGPDTFTPVGRAAFVYLDKPNTKFEPAKYGLTMLFDKNDEKVKEQLKVIQALCKEMLAKVYGSVAKVPKTLELPIFRDGDTMEYEGFAGNWVLVAKNEKIQNVAILDDVLPEAIEAGMLVRAQIQPYCDKKGVSYKLRGLRLVKDDGVRFNAAPPGDSLLKGLDDAVDAVKINGKASASSESSDSGAAESGLDVL